MSKNSNEEVLAEINGIKRQVNDISYKVDLMLEILNNFTIMLAEEEEEEIDDYDSDESWAQRDDEFWQNDGDE